MSLVAGLSPNYRTEAPPVDVSNHAGVDVIVEETENSDVPEFDDSGAVIRIKHGDGSVTLSLDGKPIIEDNERKTKNWFDNLVEDIDQAEVSRICDDLLRGIEDDLTSRKDWMEDRAQGIRMLGLRVEVPGTQGGVDGAPVEGMSKVRHPLLQEAVLRFQANARSELLPTDGPVKIRDDGTGSTLQRDQTANALEKDMNHFLTITASEYYPDTDRMLLMLGFGGTCFKKVYFSALRNRPMSESVDADDLIVNNAATDLRNAKRVTHRSFMQGSTVRRMQILGHYRDVKLDAPRAPKQDAVREEKHAQQGTSDQSINPDDRNREIYECYCDLDVRGFEHKLRGKESGLEIPYRVTIDVSSRTILSIVRNYDEGDKLPEARETFVKYAFVPGIGFYDIGLLHILGNTTNAVTAAWRELLDMGMYACFPGFLISDTAARQDTNIFRVPPGGGAQVKTGGQPLKDVVMPLPYSAQAGPALMSLVQEMTATGMRVGGTSEQAVGEGTQNTPVGTTLALIDQATKVLNAVHKRMHTAQAQEFRLLIECFREHPESFWQFNKRPTKQWDEDTFRKALDDHELTPQADPNTASQVQRLMKLSALKLLQQASPNLYDPIAIDTACIIGIGFSNPQQFMAPPSAMGRPSPETQKTMQEGQAKLQEAQAKTTIANAKAMEAQHKVSQAPPAPEDNTPSEPEMMKAQASLIDAKTKSKVADIQHADTALRDANSQEDRRSKERLEVLNLAKEIALHPGEAAELKPVLKKAEGEAKPKGGAKK